MAAAGNTVLSKRSRGGLVARSQLTMSPLRQESQSLGRRATGGIERESVLTGRLWPNGETLNLLQDNDGEDDLLVDLLALWTMRKGR